MAANAAGQAAGRADLDLLGAYEPVVRYTRGELFFPTAVEPYAEQSSLWAGVAEGESDLLVAAQSLSLERLCEESRLHGSERCTCALSRTPSGAGSIGAGEVHRLSASALLVA